MSSSRAPDPTRRSEQSRRATLEAAWELCREVGYARLSVDAIAARAGVGKQTIYRWWPSKGAVVADAVLEATLSRVRLEDTGDLERDLRAHARSIVQLLCDADLGPRIAELIGEAQHDPALAQRIVAQIVGPVRERSRAHLARAQGSGLIRAELDRDVIADLLFGPLWFRFLVSKAPLSRDYADQLVEAALAGVRAAGGRKRTTGRRPK